MIKRELVQQLDKFCKKIGGKWKTVFIEKVELGKVVVRGKVDNIITDCLVVETNRDVYSQREINGNLQGLPRLVKWNSDLLDIVDNFRSLNIQKLFYNAELQTYSLVEENGVISATSLNRYNEKKDELTSKATRVLTAIKVFCIKTNNQLVKKLEIKDLSHLGQVCLIECTYEMDRIQYLYRGNGVVEEKRDGRIIKLNEEKYGIVRHLIMDIEDNFPDLHRVLLNKSVSTLYLHKEDGECYVCEYLEGSGKVHEIRTVPKNLTNEKIGV